MFQRNNDSNQISRLECIAPRPERFRAIPKYVLSIKDHSQEPQSVDLYFATEDEASYSWLKKSKRQCLISDLELVYDHSVCFTKGEHSCFAGVRKTSDTISVGLKQMQDSNFANADLKGGGFPNSEP